MTTDNPAITPDELLAHAAWLERLARRLVGGSGLADDLVQDTWRTSGVLERRLSRGAWEGDDVTDVAHARRVDDRAL